MKEYKVLHVPLGSIKMEKNTTRLEETLNQMASEGWTFIHVRGLFLFFEREK